MCVRTFLIAGASLSRAPALGYSPEADDEISISPSHFGVAATANDSARGAASPPTLQAHADAVGEDKAGFGGISRERSQKRWRPTSPPCRRLAWWRLLGATPPAYQDGISPTGPAGSDDVTRALSASSLDGHAPRRSASGSPLTHPLEHEHCRKPGTKFGGAVRWKRRRRRSFPVCPRPPGLGIPTGAAAAAAWTSETEFSVRMFRSSSWKKVGQAPINPELKQSGQRSRSISGRRIACPRWRAGRLTYASWFSHLLSRTLACCLVLA